MNKIVLIIIISFLSISSMFSQEKKFIKYIVQEGETIQSISQKLSITPYDLLKLNPDIKSGLDNVKVLIIPNQNFKSNSVENHKDYVENGFLFHKVLPKENFFRLRKQFGASKRILRKHNAILRSEDLKAGQIIKIPVEENYEIDNPEKEILSSNTKPYLVKLKETKYSISRRYGINVDKLIELNPQLKDSILKTNEIIKVPNTIEIPDDEQDYVIHQVEKGDNFYRLSNQFEITKEELLALNPSLTEGLKEGSLIKIPTTKSDYVKVFLPSFTLGKEIKAVLLLPFISTKTNIDFQKNMTSDIVTDFYLGAKMALDSLKKQGLSVHVKVFDTQNNKQVLSSIFSALDLSDIDVVIGPMFYDNIAHVSNLLRGKNIPIISPVSKKDHSSISNTYLVQETPSEDELSNKVLSYIKTSYKDQNLVIISDDQKETLPFLNNILLSLKTLDSIGQTEVIKPEKGYIKPEIFREKLVENKDNYVILATEDPVVTRDVINNLGVLPKEIKATFFTLKKDKNFDNQNDINNNLAHVNFHYPTYSFVDLENVSTKVFIESYKRINYVAPTEYAFKGFDLTYDSLLRVASYDNFNDAINAGISERLSTKFEYQKNKSGNGFVNNGVYLIKYDGLNLVQVTPNN